MPLGKKKENDDNDDDGCGKGWETGKEDSVHLFGFLLSLIFALIMPYNFVIFSLIKTMYFTLKIYVIWVFYSFTRKDGCYHPEERILT